MPDYERDDQRRGRGRARSRAYRDYSPSDSSVDSHYSKRRSTQHDPKYDDPSYRPSNAVVLRKEYTVAAPARARSPAYSDDYPRNRSRRRNRSVDTTQVFYRGRDGGYYERREYSASPVRDRRRLQRRRSSHRSPSPAYSQYSYEEYVSDSGRKSSSTNWKRNTTVGAKAAAVEAFRLRKEPGSWLGAKGARVATVALAAAGINSVLEKDPDARTSRVKAVESIIGAKVINRILNGPKQNLREEYEDGHIDGRRRP